MSLGLGFLVSADSLAAYLQEFTCFALLSVDVELWDSVQFLISVPDWDSAAWKCGQWGGLWDKGGGRG